MKRTLKIGLILIILLLTFVLSLQARTFDLDVESAILIEAETGQVLFEKNADQKMPPASITKIMTMLIAMEEIEKGTISLEDEVIISNFAASMGGSQIFLDANTKVSIEDLLKAVTIASANDASVALAEAMAGTYPNFLDWVNNRVQELGMENTYFSNTTGLPPLPGEEHYTTARDITIMSREMVKYPKILEWGNIWVDYLQLPNREAMLVNTNRLISPASRFQGMDGLKTGYTSDAGYSLAATAERDGMRLISVVLRMDSKEAREEATVRLLNYGFNSFRQETVVNKGDKVHNVEVKAGKESQITVEAAEDLTVVIRRGVREPLNKEVVIEEDLTAPINKGDILGKKIVYQEEEILGEVNLLAVEDVNKAGFFTRLWRSIINFLQGLFNR